MEKGTEHITMITVRIYDDFFVDIGPKLADQIPGRKSHFQDYPMDPNHNFIL